MIQWGDPRVLHWLWALLPLAALLFFLTAHREKSLRILLDDEAAAVLSPARRRGLAQVKAALWLLACTLAIVALARPQWGIRWQEARRRGREILVVLDASNSMRAADFKPNRLERAKLGIRDLLERLAGDRVGLVVFAGSSFLACPLTTDYGAFSMVLDDVRSGTVPRGGTAIAQALERALASFDPRGAAERVVVLVTDGEDHEGGIDRAVAALVEKRARVLAIGVGTASGEFVPAAGEEGGPLLRDRSGNIVRTSLRKETLEKIAVATGGIYVEPVADDFGWDRLFSRGASEAGQAGKVSKLEKAYAERFPWFLGASLLLLAAEAFLGDRRRTRRGGD